MADAPTFVTITAEIEGGREITLYHGPVEDIPASLGYAKAVIAPAPRVVTAPPASTSASSVSAPAHSSQPQRPVSAS